GVAITPLAIGWEVRRVYHKAHLAGVPVHWSVVLASGTLGMVFAFLAGLLALKWLSRWLEQGRWYLFGVYCLAAAVLVQVLYLRGW
ncbi:MAG TPA: undecaprenyl-diphosphate phosphatase, partial [Terriglobia bacterium]|nr:undecaprenyl-diphosphate phosphatase [Terriglobia bacterium]